MRFGGLTAVYSVTFRSTVEIHGLSGPNGAGKTRSPLLTGLYLPTSGRFTPTVSFFRPQPGKVVKAGMARTFQKSALANMTALENVMVGRYAGPRPALTSSSGANFRGLEGDPGSRAVAARFVGSAPPEGLARNLPYGGSPAGIARVSPRSSCYCLTSRRRDEPAETSSPRVGVHVPGPRPRHRGDRARHALHLHPVRRVPLPVQGRR